MKASQCPLLIIVLGVAAFWFASPVSAQQAPNALAAQPADKSEPAVPPKPAAVPAAQVASAFERLNETLRGLSETLEPDPKIIAISNALPKMRERGGELVARTQEIVKGSPTLAALQRIEHDWLSERQELESAEDVLRDKVIERDEQLTQLDEMLQVWQLTLEASRSGDAPATLRERASEALASILGQRKQIAQRRAELLVLQDKIGAEGVRASGALAEVQASLEEVHSSLLVRGEPLWRLIVGDAWPDDLTERIKQAGSVYVAEMRDYIVRAVPHLPTLVAVWLACLAIVMALRKRGKIWGHDEEVVRTATHVFDRPIAASLLFFFFLTPFAYGAGDPVGTRIAVLFILVSLLRVLPPLLERPVRIAFYGLVFFVVLDRIRELLSTQLPELERVIFQGEIGLAIGVLLWIQRPARLAQLPPRAQGRLRPIGWLLRGATLLLGISFLSNALGYDRLAELLGIGTLRSGYAVVVLYPLLRILDGLIIIAVRTEAARSLRFVQRHRPTVVKNLQRISGIGIGLLWLYLVLGFFTFRGPVFGAVSGALTASLEVGDLSLSLGGIVAFAVTVWVSFVISRMLRVVLEEDVFARVTTQRGVPYAVSTALSYSVLLIGFMLALAAAGVELGKFALLAGAFGVGIGFGLQNVVNNFVSGLILLGERPIQLGDTVQMAEMVGVVKRIGFRSSTIRTWQGAEVIVPNGALISEQVVNWTLSDKKRRVELPVGVAYGTDPERVLEILVGVAQEHPRVLEDPMPTALFLGFGDSSLDFQLRAWTSDMDFFMQTCSDLAVGINRALADAGISIPFPQRDLHLKSVESQVVSQLREESKS